MNEQPIEIRAIDAHRFGVEAEVDEVDPVPAENEDEALLDVLELGVEPVGLGV